MLWLVVMCAALTMVSGMGAAAAAADRNARRQVRRADAAVRGTAAAPSRRAR